MKEYLNGVLIPLLRRVQVAPQANKEMQASIGAAIGKLMSYALTHAIKPEPEKPQGAVDVVSNWVDLALREIEGLNTEGNNAICSVTEAHWKVHGIMNWWHQGNRSKFFFRGEHNSNWKLESSAARNGITPDSSNPLTVTDSELEELRRFQARVQSDQELFSSVFPDGRLLSLNSADWWALMQHYQGGTRLIDITSSIFCALFFACADWDGSIDTDVDGAMYLFPKEKWRPAVLNPDIIRGQNIGPTDQMQSTVEEYYNLDAHPDTVRFRESFHRNDRLLSQDGYFLWQPLFDQPLNIGQHFKFRIPASKKIRVLREMYSIGYTAARLIRGSLGAKAHSNVCNAIGVSV